MQHHPQHMQGYGGVGGGPLHSHHGVVAPPHFQGMPPPGMMPPDLAFPHLGKHKHIQYIYKFISARKQTS